MARKRMVTRTINQVTAEVMCLNIETTDVCINEYTVGGTYTPEELLEKLQELYQTDTLKLVHVDSMHNEELLLGMDEDDFIRLAKVLPPRNVAKET